jgi:NADPH-dependent 2,4-dienoyl-CoA reductase/sulfur reductase-like enzyme/nitrite reductase/ring-hydroxylating ferredoxin subunit
MAGIGGATMATHDDQPTGPDLAEGVPSASLADGGMISGHVGTEPVLLVRVGQEVLAIGGKCTHYGGPLGEGIVAGDTVRCPWHHACFSLRTGEAVRAPAFDPVPCWRVESVDGRIVVREKLPKAAGAAAPQPAGGARLVIVGGGAAGFAAAEMLRRQGFDGEVTLLSADPELPVDRPNLSKDFLAGKAPEQWVFLKSAKFYERRGIRLELSATATGLDTAGRRVALADGRSFEFDRLLLATGAEPVRLTIPGADKPHVFTLRSLADSRAIVASAAASSKAVVIGASFIGLEVAASLIERGLGVRVVAPDARPLERVLGPDLADVVRSEHEAHGVAFSLGRKPAAIEDRQVVLDDGTRLDADLVVMGVGVRPRIDLAERAGLRVDRGVLVDTFLETSVSGIFAAGDIARFPYPFAGGAAARIEHWVVAERQGQVAAMNMLGARRRYEQVPFFWSRHYDIPINYVGHAESWDSTETVGDVAARDGLVRFSKDGRLLAVASISRDRENLRAELDLEATGST